LSTFTNNCSRTFAFWFIHSTSWRTLVVW
jgi:hypothetical protein